jgi:PAS domain S-box-containing protein
VREKPVTNRGSSAEALVDDKSPLLRRVRELEQLEAPDPACACTPQGVLTAVNRAFSDSVGGSVEELVGKTLWDVFPKQEADRRFARVTRALASAEAVVDDVVVSRPDGDRHFRTTICPAKDAEGNVAFARCTTRDITEWKQAEDALSESRERFRAFSEASFETIFISEEGICLEQNAKAEQMFGYSPEEAIGKYGTDWIAPEDRPIVMLHMLTGHEQPYEVTALRKDGTTFPALLCGKMMRYKGRNVRVTSLTDITKGKKTEQTLRKSEELLRAVIEQSPIAIVMGRVDGTLEYFNRRAIETFGHRPEEVPTMERWWQLAYPDEAGRAEAIAQWLGLLEKATAGNGEIERREYRVTCRDGTVKTAIIFGVAVAGRVFAMFEDISALKRAADERLSLERQLLQAQKLESLGILAGGIAHDFNNLLSAILGNTDLALAELPAASSAGPLVKQIQTATLRAAELTRQMLDYAGQGERATEPLEISNAVREMGQLLATSISKKAELHLDLADELARIVADPTQLRQIIMNFILNASDAIGEKRGVISVRTGRGGRDPGFSPQFTIGTLPPGAETVFLEVADSGCGIDADTLPRIFDPFFTTKFSGRGLGLSATQGIVLRHHGQLQVRSRPGAGSVFRVIFPASAEAAARGEPEPPRTAASSPNALQPWQASGTILLVDDDAPVRTTVARMLTTLGFEVLAAADGQEALAIYGARQRDIRAILLDLTMPRMGGHETSRELRRLQSAVPVILCSGYDVSKSEEQFSDLAFSGYLQKPYRLEDLKGVLAKALG